MEEIRLNVGNFWVDAYNVESQLQTLNMNIKNNKGKKIIIDLPMSYFDSNIFNSILDLNAIEFESTNGCRYSPQDILLTNNKFKNIIENINYSELSQFERFIAIYSFVTNYKPYKLYDEKYYDIGRSPYLFLDDDYINCVGICQFLCILCRQLGINITMYADEYNEHAICYLYIKDDKYGIDGYFSTDPTNDIKRSENSRNSYINMIGRITGNNEFEKFLNSNRQLSYLTDNVYISLFSGYVSFLKTSNSIANRTENPIDLIYSFRNEFRTKENSISYHIIYDAISKASNFFDFSNDDKDFLKNMLFIKELREKASVGESIDDLVEFFIASSTGKKKR